MRSPEIHGRDQDTANFTGVCGTGNSWKRGNAPVDLAVQAGGVARHFPVFCCQSSPAFHGLGPSPTSCGSLQAIQALNQTSFDVTFRTLRDRKLYAGKLAQLDCVDVRVYGSAESIITASRIPDEFDDNYVRNYLSRFGQGQAFRQKWQQTVQSCPQARRLVFFSYVGQVRTCIKCYQEGHEAANCTVRFCNKCQTVGHIASDCTNDIVCNNCNKEGHTARRCPTSYANKLQLENKWTKGPEAVVDKSTCSSGGVPAQVEQTESETVAQDSPMSQGQDPDEQDNSEEESADSSEEDTEEKMELILTPSPGNESESTQPKTEAQSKTSRRKNRRRNKVRGKNNEPPNQNNEIEQAVTHELMAKETGVKKTTISETTGTSSDEKDSEFTGMEVGKMTAKRPAASTRSDDEECHISHVEETALWEREWGGQALWSLGTPNARGVGILLSPSLDLNVVKKFCDEDGRVVCVVLSNGTRSLRICNVYAPNEAAERSDFYRSLSNFLSNADPTILCGDFNCIESLSLDKRGGNPNRSSGGAKVLRHLCDNHNLHDPWRQLNPDARVYTWRSGDNSVACRLDRFYVSKSLPNHSHTFLPAYFTDHDCVKIEVLPTIKKKSSLWKCNVSILKNQEVQTDFITSYKDWQTLKPGFPSLRSWWDDVKQRTRSLFIKHSCKIAKEKRDDRYQLNNRLGDLTNQLNAGNVSPATLRQYQRINPSVKLGRLKKFKLTDVDSDSPLFVDALGDQGSVIGPAEFTVNRCQDPPMQTLNTSQRKMLSLNWHCLKHKVPWYDQELNTSRKERSAASNGRKKNISAVRDLAGQVVHEDDEISNVYKEFYAELFTEEPVDPVASDQLCSNLDNTLSTEEVQLLETPLSSDELFNSVHSMAINKCPGSDGLPKEFYITFWHLMGDDLPMVFNEVFDAGELSPSQKFGVVTLLPKKGDELDPKNKRPISLLNTDYKILTKVLNNRLQSVVSSVLHPDQTCGVPGRSIQCNLRLIRDIVVYANNNNIDCAIVSLDQAKAFDRVNISFLHKTLTKMGFGPSFRKWVSILYHDIASSVLVNGSLSSPFALSRGVRQGCPLSPLLYAISLEPFAATVRKDPDMCGVKLPGGYEAKMSLYADDNSAFPTSDKTIVRLFDLVDLYNRGSGSRLNLDKCEGLWLGKWRHRPDSPVNIQWTSGSIRLLGGTFGNIDMPVTNWREGKRKFVETLQVWGTRSLSFTGRVTVANALAAAKLWYIASVFIPPDSVIKEIETALFHFFWDKRREMVSRNTIYLPPEKGGWGLTNIAKKAKCLYSRPFSDILSQASPSKQWDTGCTTRSLYNDLLMKDAHVPTVCLNKRSVPWSLSFQSVQHPLLENRLKDTAWLVAHHALKTNALLYSKWRFIRSGTCPRNNCNGFETMDHVMWSCNEVLLTWTWVEGFIRRWVLSDFRINRHMVIFGIVPTTWPKCKKDVIIYIIAVTRKRIWSSRCEALFDKTFVTHVEIVPYIKECLRSRLKLDFVRLGEAAFLAQWCSSVRWAKVVGGKLRLRF
ncbi:hypothetical protein Bbelb_359560 [Branchiostoma belcheri]|nr:hypothetical protein Bbelb_359560 [Branchiostoma belcheri]